MTTPTKQTLQSFAVDSSTYMSPVCYFSEEWEHEDSIDTQQDTANIGAFSQTAADTIDTITAEKNLYHQHQTLNTNNKKARLNNSMSDAPPMLSKASTCKCRSSTTNSRVIITNVLQSPSNDFYENIYGDSTECFDDMNTHAQTANETMYNMSGEKFCTPKGRNKNVFLYVPIRMVKNGKQFNMDKEEVCMRCLQKNLRQKLYLGGNTFVQKSYEGIASQQNFKRNARVGQLLDRRLVRISTL